MDLPKATDRMSGKREVHSEMSWLPAICLILQFSELRSLLFVLGSGLQINDPSVLVREMNVLYPLCK